MSLHNQNILLAGTGKTNRMGEAYYACLAFVSMKTERLHPFIGCAHKLPDMLLFWHRGLTA